MINPYLLGKEGGVQLSVCGYGGIISGLGYEKVGGIGGGGVV